MTYLHMLSFRAMTFRKVLGFCCTSGLWISKICLGPTAGSSGRKDSSTRTASSRRMITLSPSLWVRFFLKIYSHFLQFIQISSNFKQLIKISINSNQNIKFLVFVNWFRIFCRAPPMSRRGSGAHRDLRADFENFAKISNYLCRPLAWWCSVERAFRSHVHATQVSPPVRQSDWLTFPPSRLII